MIRGNSALMVTPPQGAPPVAHRRPSTEEGELGDQPRAARPRPQARGAAPRCAPPPLPNRALRWAFYVFMASLLFEGLSLGIPAKLPHLTGALLLLAALLQSRVGFRWPPAAFWCFIAYLYAGIISMFLQSKVPYSVVLAELFVHFQLVVLFGLAYNVMRCHRVAQKALW